MFLVYLLRFAFSTSPVQILVDSGLNGIVWNQSQVGKLLVCFRAGSVMQKPTSDLFAFVGHSISANHWIFHDLERDWTDKVIWNRCSV